MNGTIFHAYTEQILVSTLSPGDIVVMDNLPCHKVAGIQEAIENWEARLLYLPPTTPTSILSNRPSPNSRRCRERPVSGHVTASGTPLHRKLYSSAECRNLFRNSGYPT
jgi:hypothetical protein